MTAAKNDIWIGVGRGNPVLQPLGFFAAGDDTNGTSAVVYSYRGVGGRPKAGDQAAIGIDGWGNHGQQLGHQLLLPGHKMMHHPAHVVFGIFVVKKTPHCPPNP